MATPSSSLALKEYLKRYQSTADEIKKSMKKKKKKEKPKPQSTANGVIVFDNDPVWQKPVKLEDSDGEDDSVGDGMPQIEEDIEVKRMKRLEAIRSLKPYHSISEDGSGWIPIPKPSKTSTSELRDLWPPYNQHDTGDTDLSPALHKPSQLDLDENTDMSPPRQRRGRLDTPSPESKINVSKRQVDDLSPPRRPLVDDLSPPRRAARGFPVADLSPADDLSPPHRFQGSTEADLSPPRKATKQPLEDLSPPRRSRKHSLETTEAHNTSVLDLSTTGRGNHRPSESSRNIEPPLPKETRMGGLLSAREMREEIHIKKKDEKSRFASMDPLLSGRDAEAVHRDKEGKKISKEKLKKPKEEKKEYQGCNKEQLRRLSLTFT
ncbi:hypothetical protein KSP40_PGU006476 [Platanthera guangdongensis]|uniref:BUD13 homolog n=1 Tax=Platanthera guangdongensis TaxID=2320717 RepID=A0ABR2LSL1_9ASPA